MHERENNMVVDHRKKHGVLLLRLLTAILLFACALAPLACHNDQKLTDRHEQTLQEEDE